MFDILKEQNINDSSYAYAYKRIGKPSSYLSMQMISCVYNCMDVYNQFGLRDNEPRWFDKEGEEGRGLYPFGLEGDQERCIFLLLVDKYRIILCTCLYLLIDRFVYIAL